MARALGKVTRGLVLVLAWVFILLSIVGVLVCAAFMVRSGGDQRAEFIGLKYHVGTAYEGLSGVLLAVGEAVALITCLLLSLSHRSTPRRIGHTGLFAWVSLCLGNAMCSFEGAHFAVTGLIAALGIFWLCIVLRAIWYWTPPALAAPRSRPA